MGEIIKHGLIQDGTYYDWLKSHVQKIQDRDPETCLEMIVRSDEIKRKVVEEDPREQGSRALLNFGHTLGHALEKRLSFSMLHGHCVGLGCLGAMRICADRGYVPEEAVTSLRTLMERLHMPVCVGGIEEDGVIQDTRSDKKMDGDTIRFILLHRVGEAFIDLTVTEEEMRRGLSSILR